MPSFSFLHYFFNFWGSFRFDQNWRPFPLDLRYCSMWMIDWSVSGRGELANCVYYKYFLHEQNSVHYSARINFADAKKCMIAFNELDACNDLDRSLSLGQKSNAFAIICCKRNHSDYYCLIEYYY